jgi:dTDP-4-amino-4,6-dideoxygalactose transaminase
LIAAGIGIGDEVIIPSFSFAATANSVALTGATPVFVDIDLQTYNIDSSAIEAAITNKTKAIQPVHLFGLPANMPAISEIAQRNNLFVFEDSAQAHFANINKVNVGQFGNFATFSFYPTKNMTAGEGGMIVSKDESFVKKLKMLRNQGMESKYINEIIGFNLRMTDIHAAIGRVQLKRLSTFTRKRIENAAFYNSNLENVITPYVPNGYEHVYHQYTIRIPDLSRERVISELNKNGVQTGVYYPKPIHKLPAFNSKIELPITKLACEQVLSLPIHPKLKSKELEQVVKFVNLVAKVGA